MAAGARAARVRGSRHTTGDGSLSGTKARAISIPLHPALHPATNAAVVPGPTHAVSRVPPPHDGHGAPRQCAPVALPPGLLRRAFQRRPGDHASPAPPARVPVALPLFPPGVFYQRQPARNRVANHRRDGQARRVRFRFERRSLGRFHRHAQLSPVPRFTPIASFWSSHANYHIKEFLKS